MREVPLAASPEALELVARLRAGTIDLVVLLTGVGTRALATVVEPVAPREELVALLSRVAVIPRGPKPVAVLKEWKVPIAATVPEPNTWRELLATIDERIGDLRGKTVAVQEYGVPNARLYGGLSERGASVLAVPVYRWAAPEDPGPLRAALDALVRGELDVALFTSANQVYSVLGVANERGIAEAVRESLGRMVVASVGPVCSEALAAHGIAVDVEPSHPKMGHLVQETAERAGEIRVRKRGKPG